MKPSPYDPHHVTLNLIQDKHSRIMQLEIEIQKERDLRRKEIERSTDVNNELEVLEEVHKETLDKMAAYIAVLLDIEKRGKGYAPAKARGILKKWGPPHTT